ncbi:MAG: hypothetical protein LBN21_08830 [Treponema sp.]|jgi:hypothetical protein|nr:hypothetical protein [Treponema sp.]
MGYSQSFHDSVNVSGSVSVSYPASEHGGSTTAYYSENVPIDVTINVATEPFDASVSGVNHSIDLLTGAVTVMNAAQCAAIQEKTTNVSQALINGFYGTINSELSRQMQSLSNEFKSKIGLILEQGKAVTQQQQVMETDYHRISSRYRSVFANLDDECHKRILALDRSAFDLSEKVLQYMLNGIVSESAGSLVSSQEESSSRAMILTSGLYKKTQAVIENLLAYISQDRVFQEQLAASLNEETAGDLEAVYVPVIFSEGDRLESASLLQECFQPPWENENAKTAIAEEAASYSTEKGRWEEISEDERASLNREFNALAESSFIDDPTQKRINDTMMNLWRESRLSVLAGEKN